MLGGVQQVQNFMLVTVPAKQLQSADVRHHHATVAAHQAACCKQRADD